MAEETDLNLDLDQIETDAEKKLQARNRYQQLANEKNEARQKAEAAEQAKAVAEAKAAQLEKEREFYKNFTQLSSKYPEATHYQEQILERVNKGYDLEEAALGLLAKEGKLGVSSQPVRTPSIEGGSALNNISEGDKPLQEMSAAEKLAQLQELEKTGELAQALRAGINRS